MRPRIMILHASGINRDAEAARACELAGGRPEIIHINELRSRPGMMDDYALLLLPGGFSYGDALGAGGRLALDLRVFLAGALQRFVDQGRLVLGICNGFQTLVKAGLLLPGDMPADDLDGEPALRPLTLTANASGHFECRWVHLAVDRSAATPYLGDLDELIFCPVAHGEGNFQVTPPTEHRNVVDSLDANNQIVFRYVDPDGQPAGGQYPLNPNGSVADIAGICNPRGNVIGLMPHPEDHVVPIQNPLRRSRGLSLPFFQAMVGSAVHV